MKDIKLGWIYKMKNYIESIGEQLFGNEKPEGTAQENYDSFIQNWGKKVLVFKDGRKITVSDIQNYMDSLQEEMVG